MGELVITVGVMMLAMGITVLATTAHYEVKMERMKGEWNREKR